MAITASEKRERFDKCTQVCYVAKMARNVKSQIYKLEKLYYFER